MPLVIKAKGSGAGKSAASATRSTTRKSTAAPKTTAKATTRKTTSTRKPAAAKATTAKATTKRTSDEPKRRGRPKSTVDNLNDAQLKIYNQIAEAGEDHRRISDEHAKSVDRIYELIVKARAQGIAMPLLEEATGISRQWLYKMGFHSGRDTNGKPAAKKTAAKKPAAAKKTTTRARTTRQPAKTTAKKGTSSRVRIKK